MDAGLAPGLPRCDPRTARPGPVTTGSGTRGFDPGSYRARPANAEIMLHGLTNTKTNRGLP